jgi:hypothetical protein
VAEFEAARLRPYRAMTAEERRVHVADAHGRPDLLLEDERAAFHCGDHPALDPFHQHGWTIRGTFYRQLCG